MKIKKAIRILCARSGLLKKVVLGPYAMHCEKRRVRRETRKNYRLDAPSVCLQGVQRQPGINFWFLVEQGHNNIGDIAIGVAEKRFFERYFPKAPKHFIYEPVFEKYRKTIAKQIRPGDVIVLRGGGSIGNTIMHEKHREEIIRQFNKNLIVSMPQTMCFPETKKGRKEKARASKIYENNQNLLLIAREEKSFRDMQEAFPKTDVRLTPDIVMTMDFHLPVQERDGILLCFRSDWEKCLSTEDAKTIEVACRRLSSAVQYTDMYAEESFVPMEKRETVLAAKIAQFKKASLVITDRLHGMVFCAITGTPCIALTNYNHKVEQTYQWLKDLPYIRYCRTVEEVLLAMPKMYGCPGEYSSDFTAPYFEEIAGAIAAYSQQCLKQD